MQDIQTTEQANEEVSEQEQTSTQTFLSVLEEENIQPPISVHSEDDINTNASEQKNNEAIDQEEVLQDTPSEEPSLSPFGFMGDMVDMMAEGVDKNIPAENPVNNQDFKNQKSLIYSLFELFEKNEMMEQITIMKNEPLIQMILPVEEGQELFDEEKETNKKKISIEVLNRYFNLQLCALKNESLTHRLFLIDGMTNEEWLVMFENQILTFVKEKNLPVFINI